MAIIRCPGTLEVDNTSTKRCSVNFEFDPADPVVTDFVCDGTLTASWGGVQQACSVPFQSWTDPAPDPVFEELSNSEIQVMEIAFEMCVVFALGCIWGGQR